MKRTVQILFILLFSCFSSLAQVEDSLQKPKAFFCSRNELGGLIGIGHIKGLDDMVIKNPEWALELISTNGIRFNQWFIGAGLICGRARFFFMEIWDFRWESGKPIIMETRSMEISMLLTDWDIISRLKSKAFT